VTSYEYDNDGNVVAEVSAEGRRTTNSYDGVGRTTASASPRGNEPGADPADFTTTYVDDDADLTSGTKQAATAYVQRGGGYVVLNDQTRAVVQVSNLNKTGWKPVWEDPRRVR
jgi:YD repeat-containing protein